MSAGILLWDSINTAPFLLTDLNIKPIPHILYKGYKDTHSYPTTTFVPTHTIPINLVGINISVTSDSIQNPQTLCIQGFPDFTSLGIVHLGTCFSKRTFVVPDAHCAE